MRLDTATIDRLRELGATDEMLRWLEHPEAVRVLLKGQPADRNGECPGSVEYDDATGDVCGRHCGGSEYSPHLPDCPVAAAWRTLGDPRGAADIELAHEEAIYDDSHRSAARLRRQVLDRVEVVVDPNMKRDEIRIIQWPF